MLGQPGYQQQQYVPPLPFDPTQIQKPFIPLTDFSPPVTFNLGSANPQLDQYEGLITARCAMEIQEHAQEQPLRIFMYNRMSVNNFLNDEFKKVVYCVVQYVAMFVEAGQATQYTIEADIRRICSKMIRLFCLNAVAEQGLEGLSAFIPPEQNQAIAEAVQEYRSVAGQLDAFVRQRQQPQQYGYQYQQPQQRSVFQQPALQQFSQGHQVNRNAVVSNRGQQFNPSPSGGGAIGDRYSQVDTAVDVPTHRAPAAQLFRQPTKETTMTQNDDFNPIDGIPDVEILVKPGEDKTVFWRPTSAVPVLPVYRPSQKELFLKKVGDDVTYVLKDRSMDFDKHNYPNLSSSFGGPQPYQDVNDIEKVDERLVNALGNIRKEEQQSDVIDETNPDASSLKTLVNKTLVFEVSQAAAWTATALKRSRLIKDGNLPDIYRTYAYVAEPIVGKTDDTDYIRDFAVSTSYLELRKKIIVHRDTLDPELLAAINRRMTKAVNRVIKMNLSIPFIEIESFTVDIEDLLALLGRRYGERILKVFQDKAESVICRVMQVIEAEDGNDTLPQKMMTEDLLSRHDFDDSNTPEITYLGSYQSLTLLNVLANELDIELDKNTAATLFPHETPTMYAIAEAIITEGKKFGGPVERYLVRTNDGRLMEITEGFLAANSIGITRIS